MSKKRKAELSVSEHASKKRMRLSKKGEAENRRKAQAQAVSDLLQDSDDDIVFCSSSGDDSFVVYEEDDEILTFSEDSLDLVSSKLRQAIGGLPEDLAADLRDVLEMPESSVSGSNSDLLEPRRLRAGLGQEVSDDEPQCAEVSGRHSKKFLEWRQKVKGRDRLRAKGKLMPTNPADLVCPELGLKTPLFFHQIVGLAWCMLREEIPFLGLRGGILADDMGAGKTLQMLSLVAMDKVCGYAADRERNVPHRPPTLVVCPAMLTGSWVKEAQTHFGHEYMNPLLLNTANTKGWQDNIKVNQLLDADVVIVSYAGLRGVYTKLRNELRAAIRAQPERFRVYLGEIDLSNEAILAKRVKDVTRTLEVGFHVLWNDPDKWSAKHFLFGYPWRRAVFDECTHFKNDSTRNYEAVRCIDAERKWSLSGTPLENHSDELFAQFDVLGIVATTPVISDKTRWRKLVSRDEFGCEIRTVGGRPTSHALKILKRDFLNVLVLRREIQTISFIDPLTPYVTRATANEATVEAWTRFSDLVYRYRNDLDSLDEAPPQLENLPGFYWRIKPERFAHSYRRVERWLQDGTGISISDVATSVDAARTTIIATGMEVKIPEDPVERAELFQIQSKWPTGEPLVVWKGFGIPKPLLLLGRMHKLEKAVYTHLTTKSSEDLTRLEGDEVKQQKVAFLTVVNCRFASADYRFPLSAPEFLDEKCGSELWNKDDPSFTIDARTRSCFDKEERDNLQEVVGESVDEGNAYAKTSKAICRVPDKAPTKYLILDRYSKAVPADDKILVFCDMVRFFPQIRKYLESQGHRVAVLRGDMSDKERELELTRFRRKGKFGARIFLLSLMLAKQGLNLQEANHVVLYCQWWNPSVESQAERRVLRPGQKKTVYFVRIALLDTIDEIVITRAGVKTEMIKDVIGHDDGLITTGANFSRPEENRGLFVDTTKPPPANETLEDLLKLPLVDFSPDEDDLEKIRQIHNPDGRINKRNLANVVMETAQKQTWRFVEEHPELEQ